jgi:SPP1 gp7 family putative phage head morphogenesis protein
MAGFDVTADPQRFDEAVDWFRKRTVLTKKESERLGSEAGRRAFWIGGGLQLTQIQRVFDKLGTAIENNTPFDEWRKTVKKELRDEVHAETVFRNATQRALNAGRWRQMREPGVLAFRPYWLFDGIRDSRQSKICKLCHGIILPADHPWWATHTPALHHRCRSSIRNLRSSEAHRRGITNVPPVDAADDGFGLSPEGEPEWKPDPKKTDPALLKELQLKEKKPRPAPAKPPPGPPKEHNTKHWEKHYAAAYGEAAPNVAWGRTMLERGLDRAPVEHIAELTRLQRAGVPGEYGRLIVALRAYDPNRPLRGTNLTYREQYALMLSEHSLSIERGAVLQADSADRRVTETKTFYAQLADKSVRMPTGWEVRATQGVRAYASPTQRLIELGSSGTPTAVHEFAHAIEFSDTRALQRSLAFLAARTKGEPLQKLRKLTGIVAYDDSEEARPDKFINAYVGKNYGSSATEVTSMGYQAIAGENSMLADLQANDKEMLFFLLGQLAGR